MSVTAGVGSPLSVRVPDDVLRQLDEVAAALERSRSWVILRALRTYLAENREEILLTVEGAAQLARGEGVDFDDALAEVDALIDAAERKQAARS